MKINICVIGCFLIAQMGFAQLRINLGTSIYPVANHTAFIDASSSSIWNGSPNNGKGMVFPRADLIALTTMMPETSLPTNNPNRFDGMLVYNTATGTSGIGGVAVKPGFYFYSNQSTNVNGGTWISVGSNSSAVSVVAVVGAYTALDTDATILCDATTAGFTLTLPNPVTNSGKTYVIRKVDTTNNAVTFSPALKFAIGAAPITSLNYTKTLRVQSDGTSWNIID